MRDTMIARRTLLALAAGAAGGICVVPVDAQSRAKEKPRRPRQLPRIIALDPGHGGVDPGAISPHGIYEKNLTLPTVRELARQLEATGRYRTLLTRRGDTFVSLRQRVARARTNHAALFLSLPAHAPPPS